jgi:hypothetical protein
MRLRDSLHSGRWLASLTALCVLSCSREVATGTRVPAAAPGVGPAGSSARDAFGVEAGTNGAAGSGAVIGAGVPGNGSMGDEALSVRVQDTRQLTIKLLTLACKGDCADIEAVAVGGHPPYAFSWEDGSTAARRTVCLEADKKLSVTAVDTPFQDIEFGYKGQTAVADVSAIVLGCNADAGVPPTGEPGFCLKNPSFEGTPSLAEAGLQLPDWNVCAVTPDVNPLFASLAASDGKTYLGIIAASATIAESAGAAFCSPLQASKPISFSVDVAVSSYAVGPAKLELWGGSTSCSKDQLLWTTPEITDVDHWHSFCGALAPSAAYPFLTLWPTPTTFAGAYVLVDNFQSKNACP